MGLKVARYLPPPYGHVRTTERLSGAGIIDVSVAATIDEADRQILDLLSKNAGRTMRDIAERVNLTVAPVGSCGCSMRRCERIRQRNSLLPTLGGDSSEVSAIAGIRRGAHTGLSS
jgi:hypothetical protein